MNIKLDKKDEKIIEILKEHSDYTTRQIAKKTLLPITTIHNRIKKLKQHGIIKKFTIQLDNKKIGKSLAAYILIYADLHLLKENKKTQYDLALEIKKLPFVEKVDITTGEADLVAIVRVKDIEELDQVLLGKIQLVDGISKTRTLVIIHED